MAINFSELLTTDQKRAILTNKITEFAAQAYQVSLNKETLGTDASEETVTTFDNDLALLEKAINVYKAELDSLPE